MRASIRDLVVLSAALLAVMACRRSDRASDDLAGRVGTATLTGALVYVPTDIAREQLAQARCQHASQCEGVGEGKRYSDLSDCTVRVQRELQLELGRTECPSGVDEIALRRCVDLTANAGCSDDPATSARREAVCAVDRICKRTQGEHRP